jgi:hypothetical protein
LTLKCNPDGSIIRIAAKSHHAMICMSVIDVLRAGTESTTNTRRPDRFSVASASLIIAAQRYNPSKVWMLQPALDFELTLPCSNSHLGCTERFVHQQQMDRHIEESHQRDTKIISDPRTFQTPNLKPLSHQSLKIKAFS